MDLEMKNVEVLDITPQIQNDFLKGDKGDKGEKGDKGDKGEKGDKGDTALSVEIGTITTGEPGSEASVENSGTNQDLILDITIPKGDKGDTYTITEEDKEEIAEMVKDSSVGKKYYVGETVKGEIFNDYAINESDFIKGNLAYGSYSHVEGSKNIAQGYASHAEGSGNAIGKRCYLVQSENVGNKTLVLDSVKGIKVNQECVLYFAIDSFNTATVTAIDETTNTITISKALNILSNGIELPQTIDNMQNWKGVFVINQGIVGTTAISEFNPEYEKDCAYSHTEGFENKSLGLASHTENRWNRAIGTACHSEGENTEAIGYASHSERRVNFIKGNIISCRAEMRQKLWGQHHIVKAEVVGLSEMPHIVNGSATEASGSYSHSERQSL